MKSKTAQVLLSTALTLTAALFANQAQATPLTFSTSGTIGPGYDYSGTFFGVTNYNLTGLNFTLVTTIDPTSQSNSNTDSSTVNETYGNNAIPYSETVTINGVTKTFSGLTSYSITLLDIYGQVYGGSNQNDVVQFQDGYTTDGGTYLVGDQYVEGPGNYGLGLSFNQVWSYTPQSSDDQFTSFEVSGSDGNVYFRAEGGADGDAGNLTNISINESNSTVPEPSSIALLGAALLGFVAVRRRYDQ